MKHTLFLLAGSFALATASYVPVCADESREVNILFTHDIHDYYYPTETIADDGSILEHGGAAKLATLIKENTSDNSIYVDAGDFSMGTLLQAAYSTDAAELQLLGMLGCEITTFGNHEFDYGASGITDMLNKAMSVDGIKLPQIVCANVNFDGELDSDRKIFKKATEDYGMKDFVIKEINGVKIAFMGLMGYDSISCAPTSGQEWDDYIDTAKRVVKDIGDSADIIVAISHSGTASAEKGEDIDLAKKVPEIDLIISGHTHTTYSEPVKVGDTLIISDGCYLQNLGKLSIDVADGKISCKSYTLLPIDSSVKEDEDIAEFVENLKQMVNDSYLADYGYSFDEVLADCPFDFTSLQNMYNTHEEYPMGDLIADAYMYAAKQNGINDIDVALVGLGTIRSTFPKGAVTVADAFESCSLGVGEDGSAGHPLLASYITGKELKLLVELDASLGPMVSSIKMSYSGLEYTFNEKRIILDKVTDLYLVREDGSHEKIEDNKYYKVCCNMYAANMLGMLNGLTKGILSIAPKDANHDPITDSFYNYSLKTTDGKELKEWIAMCDYLKSLETIPEKYSDKQGRKVKVSEGGLAIFKNPGLTTWVVIIVPTLIIIWIIYLIASRKKRKAKRLAKKAKKLENK